MAAARPARARPRRPFIAVLGGGVCALLISLSARAEPSAAEIKAARQLFSEAEALRSRGDCRAAAEKLRLALQIKETPGLRFHLAHCEERLGQLVQAAADYRRASELIRSGAQAPDVERLLEPAQRSLVERVPTLRVRVPVSGARIAVDAQEVPPEVAQAPMQVDPGQHTVTVDVDGYDPVRIELIVAEGEDRVLDAKLRPRGASETAASTSAPAALAGATDPRQEPSRFGTREVLVLGESALALAGAGIGVAFLLKYEAKSDDIRNQASELPDRNSCSGSDDRACARLYDALLDRAHAGNAAIAGFVGAGVFGGAALATWFLWPSRAKSETSVTFTPLPGGAMVHGAF